MADLVSAHADSRPHGLVRKLGWYLAALLLLVAWSFAFFLVLFISDRVLPAFGPEEAPTWLAYAALAVYAFVWPFLLLKATRRVTQLNGALRTLLVLSAGVTLAAAVGAALGFGDVLRPGELGFFGRTIDTAGAAFVEALLTGLAVLAAGRPNKRIEQKAPR